MNESTDIMQITILGAGTMGRGIASFFAGQGVRTVLYDPYDKALASITEKLSCSSNLTYTKNLEDAVSQADFIIESAPENLEIKKKLYADIAPLLKESAIVASNTSTYPLSELAYLQSFAKRMLITHFFNPADIIPLVEIVESDETEVGLAAIIANFLRQHGKVPVILKKDIKGFIANRLQAALLREACFLLDEGVADAASIDTVVKESIGMRWALSGPFEITDYGGLEIWHKVLSNLLPVLNDSTEVPMVIIEKIEKGQLGFKNGEGFFKYDVDFGNVQVQKRNEDLLKLLKLRQV